MRYAILLPLLGLSAFAETKLGKRACLCIRFRAAEARDDVFVFPGTGAAWELGKIFALQSASRILTGVMLYNPLKLGSPDTSS